MSDPDSRLMRWRLIEQLVEVSSSADQQIELLGRMPVEELARSFWDWFPRVPFLLERGALSADAAAAIEAVDDSFNAIAAASSVKPGEPYLWTFERLRDGPEWRRVREAARTALDRIAEQGIPIPSLSDPDFNVARDDAP